MIRQATWVAAALIILLYTGGQCFEIAGEMSGEYDGDQYGSAICVLDFNGDGFQDLAVSAPANDDAGLSSGKIYLYFGGPSADTIADMTLVGDASSFFGKSLSSAGDFNNDGYEDLLVGAPFYDLPGTSAGAVYLFYGGPSADSVADHVLTGENGGDYYGIAVSAAGDFNNDGYADLAVGAYYNDWGGFTKAGKVYVYYGGPSPDFTADLILVGSADGERFGFDITSQDYNGDSFSDIAVGAYSYDGDFLNQGQVYVFNGGPSADSIPDLTITGDSAGYKFGWSLASGKVNNDGYWDIVMGSDGVSLDTFSTGGVFVFEGGPGFDNIADYGYSLGRLENDYLGFDVASSADVDGDGFDEILAGMPGNDDGGTEAGGAILLGGGAAISPDTSFLGTNPGQEMGKAVCFWEDFGTNGGVTLAVGLPSSDDHRGKLLLFGEEGGVENRPPILDPIGSKSGIVGVLLSFPVTASDPDGTVPELTVADLPDGAAFDDHGDGNGSFSWTPTVADIGTHNPTFIAGDGNLSDSETVSIIVVDSTDCCLLRGDIDHSSSGPDISDLVYLVSYMFSGGPEPPCMEETDVNGDGSLTPDISDLVYLVSYMFSGGPPLVPCL